MVPNIFDALGRLSSMASAKAYADIQPVIADLMEKAGALNRDNQLLAEQKAKLEKKVARFEDFRAEEKNTDRTPRTLASSPLSLRKPLTRRRKLIASAQTA